MKQGVDEVRKRYLAAELRRYWPHAEDAVLQLVIPAAVVAQPEPMPPHLTVVRLPEWAADLGVDGGLLIPSHFVGPGSQESWRAVDWWGAAFWYLNGTAEQAYERTHGPAHSYSFRLKEWDAQMWERAWVNRIALFLRRSAARELGQEEAVLFGPLPAAEVFLTHDVDAIRKTAAIRFKQSAFHGYNALRLASRGRMSHALGKLDSAVRFLFSSPDYWHFDEIEAAEEQAQVKSCFFVYGGDPRRRSLKQALLDPGYDVREQRLAQKLRDLSANGWQIGLHQSFDAWRSDDSMALEKARVEEALQARITMCRQHWLRFSWRETWTAQQAAGLKTDSTLGFNDRPGFRNGAALRFSPWDEASERPLAMESVPLVLMDSQLYDYADMDDAARAAAIQRWIGEVVAVRGTASVIWHPHTLCPDYGWRDGFRMLLQAVPGARP